MGVIEFRMRPSVPSYATATDPSRNDIKPTKRKQSRSADIGKGHKPARRWFLDVFRRSARWSMTATTSIFFGQTRCYVLRAQWAQAHNRYARALDNNDDSVCVNRQLFIHCWAVIICICNIILSFARTMSVSKLRVSKLVGIMDRDVGWTLCVGTEKVRVRSIENRKWKKITMSAKRRKNMNRFGGHLHIFYATVHKTICDWNDTNSIDTHYWVKDYSRVFQNQIWLWLTSKNRTPITIFERITIINLIRLRIIMDLISICNCNTSN